MIFLAKWIHPLFSKRIFKFKWIAGLLVAGLATVFLVIATTKQPYLPDSANYIDQARSVAMGLGFATRPFDIASVELGRKPDRLFPPGYPILIAAGTALTGINESGMALLLDRIVLFFIPLAIFIAFRPNIGNRSAFFVALLGTLSPGLMRWGGRALTDSLSLAMILIAFGLTLRAWSNKPIISPVFNSVIAGLLSGFAYLTRNANLAFLVSVMVSSMAWIYLLPKLRRTAAVRVLIFWIMGAAFLIAPWLVRNFLIFGRFQPYEMLPSTVGAWENVLNMAGALTSELLGSQALGRSVSGGAFGFWIFSALLLAFVCLAITQWAKMADSDRAAFILAGVYVVSGCTLVIVARTRYQWGEQISDRHSLQYAVFALFAIVVLLKSQLRLIVPLILVGLFLIRGIAFVNQTDITNRTAGSVNSQLSIASTSKSISEANVSRNLLELATKKGAGCPRFDSTLVISNYAYLYRILCDADVVHPGGGGMGGGNLTDVVTMVSKQFSGRSIIVVIHPGRGVGDNELPLSLIEADALKKSGWLIMENSPQTLNMILGVERGPSSKIGS